MLDNEMFKRGERVLKEDKKGEDSKVLEELNIF